MSEQLSKLATIYYGKSPNDVLAQDGLFPIIGTGGRYGQANKAMFNGPAVVVPRKGSLGNPQLLLEPFWPVDTTYAVIPEKDVDARWLYYNLLNFDLTKLNEATGVPSISRDWLNRIRFFNPNKEQKRKIGEILQAVDEAIEKTESLIAKYQQIKAGLMHDLFTRGVTPDGKLRPPRQQAPELYQETPIGWIPKKWDCRKLGDIFRDSGGYIQTGPFGSQLHAHEYTDEGVPVVMPQDIEDGKILTYTIARIPELRAVILARHRVKLGDIIIARRGELSRAAAIGQDELGWVCGTGCFLLRLSVGKLDPRFFSFAYRYDIVQRQIEGLAVGSTMPSLNNSVMSALYFPYPEESEQHQISDRLETQDKVVFALQQEEQKLKRKKSGLMHDLLTGKVRVPIHAPAEEAASV